MEYRIVLEPDDNGTILVSFPEFPEAHTYGATMTEARARALDALETVVQAYMKDRRPLPAPARVKKDEATVVVPAMVAAKMELYRALLAGKTTKYGLAKRLGWHVPQVDRLFDVRHQSQLNQLEQAAAALGKRVNVRVS